MRMLDLFAGIGGFSLAGHWMGWETVGFVEWDNFCQKVLRKNFPNIPIWGDIAEFNKQLQNGEIITDTGLQRQAKYEKQTTGFEQRGKNRIQCPDIITGGFPCQPFSHAGKRKGTDDSRYLWPEMLTTIRILKPTFVVGENVAGLVSMENGKTLERIFADLENEGYTVESFIIPACGVGAWHRRDRIWIIGYRLEETPYTNSERSGLYRKGINKQGKTEFCNQQKCESGQMGEDVPNTKPNRCNREKISIRERQDENNDITWGNWWSTEPELGRRFNGFPSWLHRHNIKGYGQNESYRRTEILRELWNDNVSKTIWEVIGGFDRIQKSEILFSIVCEYEKNPNKIWLLLEGKKTFREFVRGLWVQGKITGSPHRSNRKEFSEGEYSDSMQELSRLLAYSGEENWQISSWEDGITRVASNIPDRVNRLKSLGNAIVPQVAYEIFKAIDAIQHKN